MTSPTEPLSSNNCVVDMIWDEVIPHNHHNSVYTEGGNSKDKKSTSKRSVEQLEYERIFD